MHAQSWLKTAISRIPSELWILIGYTIGLWNYCVPFTGDEKVYTSIAMEMWSHKSWFYPLLFGEPSYYKPPFQYWATLISWNVFGFNNFGTYFPSVLALTATAALLNSLQRLFRSAHHDTSPRDTACAGIWFAGCFGTLTYGTTLQMEIWLVFFYTAIGWASVHFLQSTRWRWLYLALGLAGISALVKSPLYSVLSVLGLWIYLGANNKFGLLKTFHFYGAHLFGIALGLSWYVLILISDRDRFLNHYISTETLGKIHGNSSSPLTMWLQFSTFSAPFTLLLLYTGLLSLLAMLHGFKASPISSRIAKHPAGAFLSSTVILPALFFTLFPYRTETYLYIIIPACGLWMDRIMPQAILLKHRWTEQVIKLNGVLTLVLATGITMILILGKMTSPLLAILLALAGAAFCSYSWRLQWQSMAYSCLLITILLRLGAISLGEADIRVLKETVNQLPDRGINFYDEGKNIWHEIGTLSAGIAKVGQRSHSPQEAIRALQRREILILNDGQKDSLLPLLEKEFAGNSQFTVIDWKRWKRGFLVPKLSDITQLGERNSPEWDTKNQREYKILFLSDQLKF
jgi:4-amino-4-deoxy-L-arabinose transferase-like glycosyltransferase